jgi:hypothetical protein
MLKPLIIENDIGTISFVPEYPAMKFLSIL